MYGEEWAARFEDYANASIIGREGLFRLADASLADLLEDARILVVGCGTGSEILALASRHAGWQFKAIEPAQEMLAVCRQRLNLAEVSHRVNLHERSVEGLRLEPCDAATAILVSQHIVDDPGANRFFSEIAANLIDGATFFSADITLPNETSNRDAVLRTWRQQAVTAGLPVDAPGEFDCSLWQRSSGALSGPRRKTSVERWVFVPDTGVSVDNLPRMDLVPDIVMSVSEPAYAPANNSTQPNPMDAWR